MGNSDQESEASSEVALLRRAFAEPVAQFILVEFEDLRFLTEIESQILSIDPTRPVANVGYDSKADLASSLLEKVTLELKNQNVRQTGKIPTVWLIDDDEQHEGINSSRAEFWRHMNFLREAWASLGAQLVISLTPKSHFFARNYAADLLDWCTLRIKLKRPVIAPPKRALIRPSPFAYPHLQLSVQAAGRIFRRHHPSILEKRGGVSQEERMPFLEAMLTLGFLEVSSFSRIAFQSNTVIAHADLARWHELNFVLETASIDTSAAIVHADRLLEMATDSADTRSQRRALDALANLTDLATGLEPLRDAVALFEAHRQTLDPTYPLAAMRWSRFGIAAELIRLACGEPTKEEDSNWSIPQLGNTRSFWPDWDALCRIAILESWRAIDAMNRRSEPMVTFPQFEPFGPNSRLSIRAAHFCLRLMVSTQNAASGLTHYSWLLGAAEEVLGHGHPEIGILQHHFTWLYMMMKRLDDARNSAFAAATILTERLGRDHPTTKQVITTWKALLKDRTEFQISN